MNAGSFYDLAYFEVFLDGMRSRDLEKLDNISKRAALMKRLR